jgi:hypothetical protein
VTSTVPASGPPVIDQRRLLVIIGALLLGMLLAALDQLALRRTACQDAWPGMPGVTAG